VGGLFHAEFRTKRAGFPDLLRYATLIRPKVILGKGGELIATYKYRGPDMSCSSDGELNALRERVGRMIKMMGAGWMLHATSLRQESVDYELLGAFPDPVTQAIENERRKQYQAEGEHYENSYYLTFTYLPEPLLVNKIREFAYDSEEKNRFNPERLVKKSLEYFERQLGEYVSTLEASMSNKLERLGAKRVLDPGSKLRIWQDTQLSFLHECLTGIQQPIRIPDATVAVGLDYVIGAYAFASGIRPQINNRYIRVVAIESPPDYGTTFGVLEVLNRLGVEFRWTTRWIAGDAERTKTRVRKVRSRWRQRIRGFIADLTGRQGGAPNLDAANMADDAEMVLNDLESGAVSYGQWTSTVILMGDDQAYLESSVNFLLKNIRDRGFTARDEDVNCVEAFLGSLPGHGYENVRRPEIHNMNLADCLPLTAVWQGPTEHPCQFYKKFFPNSSVPPLFHGSASGGTPFRVNLFNGDVGHTFLGGPTGAGKSTILGLIAASHFRYPQAQFFGFEKGESMLALCLAAGGRHYNFLEEDAANSSNIGFAPFSQIQKLTERIWACDYVETILELNDVKVDLDVRGQIRSAMDLMATRPANMRSFTHLAQLIQMNEIRNVLALYESEMAGGMLNATEDTVSASRFTVFEMEQLMEMGNRHVVPVLLYLFRLIERALNGAPTIICLDEAWLMLQHPMFAEKLRAWFKVLRKANAMVIFATQELQDVANSPIASTIFSSCQTKILLPNVEALSEDNLRLYKSIGLTEREVEILTLATPKQDYFFTSPAGRRLFQLELGPVALAFMAASGKDERLTVKELYRIHGRNWIVPWAKLRGVDPAVFGEAVRLAA
jgi:type IV secretion system protein VirB4